MEILTKNQNRTRKAGELLAKKTLKEPIRRNAFVLALQGDLGGGKTTFLQGFARGLGIKDRVLSPTFVLMKRFSIRNKKSVFKNFYHLDCYRIKSHKDLSALDFKKIISDPFNIVAIEWAERVKKTLPSNSLVLKFEFINKTTRKIIFKK
ncbi:MAG: tRNA (adenosine(37)-N6)-threonylcarbamoyltransferase complex ATPase subunit type 1 TsaE [Candidatus Nealsonbacteria bacterium]|nr:tRNA (adenosine(37)-N6)-threonylcarbamoyltransferase complex ATPase subunit type 1 TsaE [Candidatus Nealsonbacteria bacterium]